MRSLSSILVQKTLRKVNFCITLLQHSTSSVILFMNCDSFLLHNDWRYIKSITFFFSWRQHNMVFFSFLLVLTFRAVRAMNETLKQNRLMREQVDTRLQNPELKKDVSVSVCKMWKRVDESVMFVVNKCVVMGLGDWWEWWKIFI